MLMRKKVVVLATLIMMSLLLEGAAIAKSVFLIEDNFLNQFRKERVRTTIVTMGGDRLEGYIKSFDDTIILFESGGDILIYKHAISSITSSDGSFRMTQISTEFLE